MDDYDRYLNPFCHCAANPKNSSVIIKYESGERFCFSYCFQSASTACAFTLDITWCEGFCQFYFIVPHRTTNRCRHTCNDPTTTVLFVGLIFSSPVRVLLNLNDGHAKKVQSTSIRIRTFYTLMIPIYCGWEKS